MDQNQASEEPAATLLVTNLETLRLLSDALRARILDYLRAEVLTAKALAAHLGMSAKQLYYHLNLMEQHGLIRVVRTRVVSGITEKSYRATAYLFNFDKSVFASAAPGDTHLPPGIALLFDATRNQLAQSYELGLVAEDEAGAAKQLSMGWTVAQVPPERIAGFRERLEALIQEFQATEEPDESQHQAYRLLVALFPVRYGSAPDSSPPEAHV